MLPLKQYSMTILLLLALAVELVQSQSFRFNSDVTPFVGSGDFLDSGNNPSEPLTNTSVLIWQPLRATFRPLNRQASNRQTPPTQPPIPTPPTPPTQPPPPPEPLALASTSDFDTSPPDAASFFSSNRFPAPSSLSSLFLADRASLAAAAAATTTTTTTTTSPPPPPPPPTRAPRGDLTTPEFDEDLPTRVPLNRFRPTKAPSVDSPVQPALNQPPFNANSGSQPSFHTQGNSSVYRITNECFECICEASTSCNANSRCQTSDVRHTRCGMMLISYDQWLKSGLSKQLVTREALARDPAADERAFYECVTDRNCAERLISIYMQKNAKDCDKDGRVDCYDIAAIHQGGIDQCQSENLLDSQYWSDFNACFGFGR